MPVCNQCKKFSNCLTIDFCEHCGAKDWTATAKRDTGNFFATARKDAEEFFGPIFVFIGAALAVVLVIGLLLGGLWLLVALVKFMWQHS